MLCTRRAGVYTEFVETGARRGWRLARRHDADGDTMLNCTFVRERVAENRTLCSSTRPAVFTKSLLTGPVLGRELTAKVLRLLPGFETKLFGSREQIVSPVASVPHLQTGTGTSASRIRCSKGPRACLMTRVEKSPAAPIQQADVGVHICMGCARAGIKGRVLKTLLN